MSKNDLRETIAQAFVDALNEDRIPWECMWANQRPRNAVSGRQYNGVNNLWLSFIADIKGYTDPRWCTYKQAQKAGWHVNPGEKATQVEYWTVWDKKQKKYIDFSDRDFIVALNPERGEDMRVVTKHFCVFNAVQISGIPELEHHEMPDIETIRAQRDVLIKNMELGFHEGGNRAYYSPSQDSITMPPDVAFEDSYGYMSTLLHECGHATGHESRLGRKDYKIGDGRFGDEVYAKEELRAEIASAFVSQELGFVPDPTLFIDNHKAYIQSWASAIKDAPDELFAAIKDASEISDYLIEKGEFKELVKQAEIDASEQKEPVEEKAGEVPVGLTGMMDAAVVAVAGMESPETPALEAECR